MAIRHIIPWCPKKSLNGQETVDVDKAMFDKMVWDYQIKMDNKWGGERSYHLWCFCSASDAEKMKPPRKTTHLMPFLACGKQHHISQAVVILSRQPARRHSPLGVMVSSPMTMTAQSAMAIISMPPNQGQSSVVIHKDGTWGLPWHLRNQARQSLIFQGKWWQKRWKSNGNNTIALQVFCKCTRPKSHLFPDFFRKGNGKLNENAKIKCALHGLKMAIFMQM